MTDVVIDKELQEELDSGGELTAEEVGIVEEAPPPRPTPAAVKAASNRLQVIAAERNRKQVAFDIAARQLGFKDYADYQRAEAAKVSSARGALAKDASPLTMGQKELIDLTTPSGGEEMLGGIAGGEETQAALDEIAGKEFSDPPARPVATPPAQYVPPDLSGHDKTIGAYGQALGSMAANARDEAKKLTKKFERLYQTPEGQEEIRLDTVAGHKLAELKDYQREMEKAEETYKAKYVDLELMERYGNLSLDRIKQLKNILEKPENDGPGFEERNRRLRAEKASAWTELNRAERIDPAGPFKNFGSKIMAAIAVGAGTWASTWTGQNPAFEMFKMAIANDIASQKDQFDRRGKALTRHQSEWGRVKEALGSDYATTMAVTALKYGKIVEKIDARIVARGDPAQKANLIAMRNQAIMEKAQASAAAMKHFAEQQAAMDTGLTEVEYVGPAGRQKPEHLKQVTEAVTDYHKNVETVEDYISSIDELMSGGFWQSLTSDDVAKATAKWEALVAFLGKTFDKGVLQQFERKELNQVFADPSALASRVYWQLGMDRVRAAGEEFKKLFRRKTYGAIKPFKYYKIRGDLGLRKTKM